MHVVASFGDSLQAALDTFARAIPGIVGALVILVVGWILAGIVAGIVEKVVNKLGGDRLTQRAGIDASLERAGVQNASAGTILGFLAKWYIRLIVLEVALPALGVAAVTVTLDRIVSYLPNVFAAIVVIIAGAFVARLASETVRGAAAGAGLGNARMLGSITSAVILVIVGVAALQQLHVADTVVNELLVAALAMLAIAGGLAFGLGGRDVAAHMLANAYNKGQETQRRFSSRPEAGAETQALAGSAQPGARRSSPTSPPNR
jgi:hypothetical protein